MPWIAAAIGGSALIGAIGANRAANTQANAQTNAANMQQGMFNTIVGQEQPFMQAGYGATAKLADLLGTSGNTGATGYGSLLQPFNPTQQQLNDYPGYQFALKTGAQAVQNANTPSAGALSGQTLKSLMGFNQGMANTNYGTYFNQYQQQQQNIYARLAGIAGLGQNAASNTGTAGTQLGTGAAQAVAAAGGSQAGGIVGATNSLAGGANSLAGLMYLNQNQPTPAPFESPG